MSSKDDEAANSFSYPRTGKRGVPQQFPRRLYTMLESESIENKHGQTINEQGVETRDFQPLIQWSDSGRAFRIQNVEKFSTLILPKYFRTSKFSSFQRNLNLYGFSKVRRGPDMDMYAHPSFLKSHPELLSLLKKCKQSAAERRRKANAAKGTGTTSKPNVPQSVSSESILSLKIDKHFCPQVLMMGSRVVSPCHNYFFDANACPSSPQLPLPASGHSASALNFKRTSATTFTNNGITNFLPPGTRSASVSEASFHTDTTSSSLNEYQSNVKNTTANNISNCNTNAKSITTAPNQGKLGLLALAMECLAEM